MTSEGRELYVAGAEAAQGEQGERLLVAGERAALRLWDHTEANTRKPEHANPYEYVAYVVSGVVRLDIGGRAFEAHAGDSYCVPAGARHTLEVLERATVVEATSPPAHGAPG